MDDKFKKIHSFINKFEGGFVNNKDDAGGMTIQGIARNYHKNWKGWEFIDSLLEQGYSDFQINEEVFSNTAFQDMVSEFYFTKYYKNRQYDRFGFELGLILTDGTVLFGFKRISKNLQKIINNYLPKEEHIVVDGFVGNNSYKALDKVLTSVSEQEIAYALLVERVDDILETVKYKSSNLQFQGGWLNRVIMLYNAIKVQY